MPTAPEQLYPLILDSIADGVFTVDAQFRITSLNAEAERITGIRRQDAVGRRCYEVLRGSACQKGCPLKRSIETGKPQQDIRVTMLNIDMEPIPISVSTAVMRTDDGELVGGVEVFRDISELESLRSQISVDQTFGDIVGASPAMQNVYRLVTDVASTDVSVLIEGESGTGKELVARAIHERSPRSEKPFVTVNCGALPDSLLESELFGYVRGAFTDARRDKPGRFQQADGGTLFLDEVGDLSPAFQVKLLRVLQEGELTPLGSTKTLEVDVRVIAATNRHVGQLVHDGSFRQDLFYRLCVVPIRIPPLRERRQDIFPPQIAIRLGRPPRELTPPALTALYDYDYPGNVRELSNILERALVLCHDDKIDVAHLPPSIHGLTRGDGIAATVDAGGSGEGTEKERLADAFTWCRLKPSERHVLTAADSGRDTSAVSANASGLASARPEVECLVRALEAHHWNRTATARALGISRSTLWRRLKEYGLG